MKHFAENDFMVMLQWAKDGTTEANQYQQAEDGKTELSLVHFTVSFVRYVNHPVS